jgi:glycosyltransferase involved in cell wall biosynthesis
MRLVNLPALRLRTAETLSHSALSAAHAITQAKPDVAFVFNAANAPVIPALRKAGIPVAVNVDGLEAERVKWRGLGARYFRWAEASAVRSADAVIADSRVIQARLEATYGISPHFIPYGAQVPQPDPERLARIGLTERGYLLVVARIEPENQVDAIIRAYRPVMGDMPLVVVGDTPYSRDHRRDVRLLAAQDARVRPLGAIHDQELIDVLYAGAKAYIHGHSVGGTNPSLLRAMGAAPVLAFDSPFNREVLGEGCLAYWRDARELSRHLGDTDRICGTWSKSDVCLDLYDWDSVAQCYSTVVDSLSDHPGSLSPERVTGGTVRSVARVQHSFSRGAA